MEVIQISDETESNPSHKDTQISNAITAEGFGVRSVHSETKGLLRSLKSIKYPNNTRKYNNKRSDQFMYEYKELLSDPCCSCNICSDKCNMKCATYFIIILFMIIQLF